MGLSIIPLTPAQTLIGETVSSGDTVVNAGAGLIAHTCPAGRRQKIHVIVNVRALTSTQNLRVRVAGGLIVQFGLNDPGVCASCVVPPLIKEDLGEFVINAGETVSCTTQNATVQGGTINIAVSVLEDVSI